MDAERLTRSTLFDLLCGDCENRKYLDHDLHDHVGHHFSRSHFGVGLKTFEETLDAHEDIDEHILARFNIFSRLKNASVIAAGTERSRMMLTKRRTPMPEKTAFAAANG